MQALSLAEARARILKQLTPVETRERVAVRAALGRVLGEDAGVLRAGRCLQAADLGLIASLGQAEVWVTRRLRVAFFSTGDELRSLGEPLGEGDIYDSNRYTLYGMLTQFGAEVLDLGVVRDEPAALRAAFERAGAEADVVIVSSGVTVRASGAVRQALAEVADIEFVDVRVKPCRPVPFGRLRGGAVLFGLSSNPIPAALMFYQIVQPALERMAGAEPRLPFALRVRTREPLHGVPGYLNFRRGLLEQGADGELTVGAAAPGDPGVARIMSRANCFIVLPADSAPVEPGDYVRVEPFAGFA